MPPIAEVDDGSESSVCIIESRVSKECLCRPSVIRFNDSACVIHVIDRISDERINEIWWNSSDHTMMKMRDRMIAKRARHGGEIESPDQVTLRGLERYFTRDHRVSSRDARRAVLEEQERQSLCGTKNPGLIALEYSYVCRISRAIALDRGIRDAVEAKDGFVPDLGMRIASPRSPRKSASDKMFLAVRKHIYQPVAGEA